MNASVKKKSSVEAIFLALVFLVVSGVAAIAATRSWFPPLASEHGTGVDRMINYLLVTVGGLFVIGNFVLGYFIWRFGRQQRITFRLPSPKTERRWAIVVVVLMALVAEGGVLILGLPVWGKLYAASPPKEAVAIEVTGEQFAWNIRYPGKDAVFSRTDPKLINDDNPLGLDMRDPAAADDIVVLGKIVVPVNRAVRVRLRSKDTLHSFFLPNFRIKQDAVPGMTIEFWFVPTATGSYEIACAELCGFGHFQMRGVFNVVTQTEFNNWLSEQSASR